MKFLTLIAAIILVAATFAVGQAQELKIKIIERAEHRAPVIIIQSLFNFERNISLKIKTDPKLDVSDILIETLSKIGMTDEHGVRIESGFDIDRQNSLVVGYSGGTAEIIKTAQSPNGLLIITSFKDASGKFVSPPADKIAIYSTSGEKLCFEYETTQQAAPKMGIAILLDRSGSMKGYIEEVKKAAQDFLNILPASAECAVGSFNTNLTYGHPNYQSCSGGGFGFEAIQAGGSTDIFTPLKDVYTTLSSSYFQDYQKAVIIVTDGYALENLDLKQELLGLKKDVLTLVYFIGGEKKDELEGLTDHFISGGVGIRTSLPRYFNALGQAYNSQKVLNVRNCQGGNHAKP